jgi:glycosyltransferase involved in cell wall biosynthesis
MTDFQPCPLVSVVMSMRNSATTIEVAIRSILAQTFTDWELILIDDGSVDGSFELANAIPDPRIRTIRHSSSKGVATRLNEAARLARGRFIARMDADDVSYPGRLAAQVSMLEADPTIDLLGSDALVFRRDGEVIGTMRGGFPHPTWCGRAAWFQDNPYDPSLRRAQDQALLLRTASFSHFARIDQVLLGYRKERIYFWRNLKGRIFYSRAMWQLARSTQDHANVVRAAYASFRQFAADMLKIACGRGDELLRMKFAPPSPEEQRAWHAIWNSLASS